ncbi:MAG: N-6 DNA methylase [Planctomycetaceae bacterium]|nr:N-6 DNA methylase [Planctomycetaceae bacterium]
MIANVLESMGFCTVAGEPTDGLVPVSQSLSILRADEASVIRQAAAFQHVDFVFFRRFDDNRSATVCAYVIDNEKHNLSEDDLASLHNVLWLHGVAPLVYVTTATRVDILSCARGADFWDDSRQTRVFMPAERIQLASDIERELSKKRRFHAQRLADGTFWDDPQNSRLSNHKKSAHEALIRAIVDVDADLDGDQNPLMRRLLLLMVLIKYLEDRRVFPSPGWFGTYSKGARSFFDVLKAGDPDNVLSLLSTLEKRFNGDVFVLPQQAGQLLTKTALNRFASLVEAKTFKQQRYLWELYSFEHIPVEIISHLYNRFLKGKDQVYTPPFLASLLLDYVMPYDGLTGQERILDPACGSGVFLVGAFRRLVTAWRAKHRWQEADVNTLKEVLTRSIFGVEHSPTAVDLTAFSLALAVCDALKPNVIWRDLKFDPLRGRNILEKDFFECVPGYEPEPNATGGDANGQVDLRDFDIVVGNPPFESKLTAAGTRLNRSLTKKRGILPDSQAAYLFLEQSLNLLKPDGRCCLLQPHGFLYNQNTQEFRTRLIRATTLQTALDFVSIRHLFDGADPKCVAILATARQPADDHVVGHLTFRRSYLTLQRLGFELDHYDKHHVPQTMVESEPHVWRINLLGGGRLWSIYSHVKEMRTIESFAQEKGWNLCEGYIVGNKTKKAPYLTGERFLPADALTQSGIDESKLSICRDEDFEGPRDPTLYDAPLVVVGEHVSLPMGYWDKSRLTFKNEIVGISTSGARDDELRSMFDWMVAHRKELQFCAMLASSRGLLTRATALYQSDIARLPYPRRANELSFVYWEKAIQDDTLNYLGDYVRLGQNSALLKQMADQATLLSYAKLFRRLLGSIYQNLVIGPSFSFDGVICQSFLFGNESELDWLNADAIEPLRELVYGEYGTVLRTKRIVRFYDQNVIFVVKPDRLRYWIRSTAIRDADDTLVDLQQQGY